MINLQVLYDFIIFKSYELLVIDFGGATYNNEKKSSIINTRQYRGPEVILEVKYLFSHY